MTTLRDISLIILAAEAFILALVPLVLAGGMVYGLWKLQQHENLPSWLRLAQAYLSLGQSYVELAMAFVARPVFIVNSFLAKVQGWLYAIVKIGGRR